MDASPALLDIIITAVKNIQRSRCAELASSAIIVWEHLITLDQEFELIWKANWSAGKCLFLINRYYGLFMVIFNNYGTFATTITNEFCLRWFHWQGWTALIACVIAEVILQIRLYALYYLNRGILLFMVICFMVSTAASAMIMGIILSRITARVDLIPGMTFCGSLDFPSYIFSFWIPMIAFESLLCGMALYRGLQPVLSDRSESRSGGHILDILVRDSIIYFLVIFATYLTNMLFWLLGTVSAREIPVGFSVAMSCVMANRVILNVRELHRELIAPTTTSSSVPVLWANDSLKSPCESAFSGATGRFGPLRGVEMEMREVRPMYPGLNIPV